MGLRFHNWYFRCLEYFSFSQKGVLKQLTVNYVFSAVKNHTDCLTELDSNPFSENTDNKTFVL